MSFIAFAACIGLAIAFFGALGVRIGPPDHRTNLAMKVADVHGLVYDSNVLLRGVPVGKITALEADLAGATVHFWVDDRYPVPVDTDVTIGSLSALGEAYIQLIPKAAGGPMLQDGQYVDTKRVSEPPYVSDLAASIGRVLNQLNPEALARIVNEADAAIPPPDAVLPNLTRTSRLLKNVAADMNGKGAVLLDNFQTLLRNASWVGPLLSDLSPYPPTIGWGAQGVFGGLVTITSHGGPDTLYRFHHLLDRVQRLLDSNGGDLKVIGERFMPQVKGIAGALLNLDPSQIMSNILATLPEDGAVTLHVSVPPN